MSQATFSSKAETLGELLEQLGGISPHRVRLHPTPGQATEQDLVDIQDRTNRLYELVDGTLVEKVLGYPESHVACELIKQIGIFLDEHDLGILAGEAGTMRLMPGLVRIPDVSFVSWAQLPRREVPDLSVPGLVPDLAVEVLSEGNTEGEMKRKLKEYFLAGVRQVWLVDPASRTIQVYTAPDQSARLTEDQILDGGDVLPGLALPVCKVFARLPRRTNGSSQAKEGRRSSSTKVKKGPETSLVK
jgi:Uma2 family endonuclease